ncbi:MAG: Restriction endonuclease [Candidatus Brocadiaceae bacterium]|nr:Restriction endonuclease [Candidatus Brocadiaceae bacterium]
MRRGFLGVLNSIAREARRAEAEKKRQQRDCLQYQRQLERTQRLRDKEEKQRYLEQRLEEAADKNVELAERLDSLRRVLNHTISTNDTIRFETLRIRKQFKPVPTPKNISLGTRPPQKEDFVVKVKTPGFLEKTFGFKKRYESELVTANAQYEKARLTFERAEREREEKLSHFLSEQEKKRQSFMTKAQQRNSEVDEFEASYRNGEYQAIITYNTMVLEQSEYPDGFPQEFRVGYAPESKQLVIDYDLPYVGVIPTEEEFKYVKTKDSIESKPRKATEVKELYQDVVAAVTLRTLHEVFEADQCGHVDVAVFNGFVHATDLSTGRPVHPCSYPSGRLGKRSLALISAELRNAHVCALWAPRYRTSRRRFKL